MEKKIKNELIYEYYDFTVKILGGLLLFKLIIFLLVVSKSPDKFASLAAGFLPSFPLATFLVLILIYLALLGNKKSEDKLIYWRAKVKALVFTLVYFLLFISAYEEVLNQAINGSQNHGLMKLLIVPSNVIYYLSEHLGEVAMRGLWWAWIISLALLFRSLMQSISSKNKRIAVIGLIVLAIIIGIQFFQTWFGSFLVLSFVSKFGAMNQEILGIFLIVTLIFNVSLSYRLEK